MDNIATTTVITFRFMPGTIALTCSGHRPGARIWAPQTCAGRLSSGAATEDWQDGDIITLYTP